MAQARTVVNVRISDDREGREAGVTRQTEDCLERVAAQDDWKLVAPPFVDNDISATSGAYRPGFEEIMSMVAAGQVDVVVAWTANRFLRSRKDRLRVIELFREKRVRLVAVRGPSFDYTTADGRLVADLIGSIDAAESERTGERVSRAARQRAEEGRFHGGNRAYGWSKSDPYLLEPGEAGALQHAAKKVVEGRSLNSVVVELNGSTTWPLPGSGQWSPPSLRQALLNPRVAALRAYKGEVVGDALWAAVLTVDEWTRVRAVLTDASRRTATGTAVAHLLAGFVYCSVCGHRLVAVGARDLYRCPPSAQRRYGWRACDRKVTVRMSALHELVGELVARRLAGLEVVPSVRSDSTVADELDAAQVRAAEISAGYARGKMPLDTANELLTAVNAEVVELKRLLAEQQRHQVVVPVDAADRWEHGDLAARRSVLTALVDGVVVGPSPHRPVRVFAPDRVRVVWRRPR